MESYEANWKDYYETLQVSPSAPRAEISAAYKRLSQLYRSDPTLGSLAKLSDINEAFNILSNPSKRLDYDNVYEDKRSGVPISNGSIEPTQNTALIGLVRIAAQKALEGENRTQVADELTKMGVPYNVALPIIDKVFQYQSQPRRKEGGEQIVGGLFMLALGAIVTWISYSLAPGLGGLYIVTTGFFIGGVITLFKGIANWIDENKN